MNYSRIHSRLTADDCSLNDLQVTIVEDLEPDYRYDVGKLAARLMALKVTGADMSLADMIREIEAFDVLDMMAVSHDIGCIINNACAGCTCKC